MQPLELAFTERSCEQALRELLPELRSANASLAEALEVQKNFRQMAVAKLLMTGVPDEFFQDLWRSAQGFLHFLESRSDEARGASHFESFFDALVCGDSSAALQLASHAPVTFDPGLEYEEDYLFFRFAMDQLLDPADRGTRVDGMLLNRFEEVAAEIGDLRFEICAGIAEQDEERFNAGLESWIESQHERFLELAPLGELDPDEALTTERISIQGLGLARIAERKGIRPQPEMRRIPSLARRLDRFPLVPPAAWDDIPSDGSF